MMPVNSRIIQRLKNLGKITLSSITRCKHWTQLIFLPVYHRVGGLEWKAKQSGKSQWVYHRVGGLEFLKEDCLGIKTVYHRVGGLELFDG